MSSNYNKCRSLRRGLILLAVALLYVMAPALPGLNHVALPGSLSVMGIAYAQDAGAPANNGNNNGTAVDNGNTLGSAGSESVPVGINDVLHITVIGQSDLTGDYQVDNTGNITMPYIGTVHVSGMQLDQVAPAITKKLNTIYNNVQVTAVRKAIGGISVTLTGALAKQGTVLVRRDAHLNDVLQQAGLSADADVAHVKITRGLPGTPQTTVTVNFGEFLTGNNSKDYNPALNDGDVIYVAHKSPVTVSVSITGDVANPGRYDMPAGSTFFDLISKAGGLTARADRNSVYIQPLGTLNHKTIDYDKASANPQDTEADPVLSDGDKIVVPELPNQPTFSITGGVLAPGVKPLTGTVTLSDAIGQADGLAPRAHTNKATVTRRTPSGAEVIKVDAGDQKVAGNFIVQPDDNINIPAGSPPQQINPLQVISILLTAYAIFHH